MKFLIFLFALAVPALGQSPDATRQTGHDCVVNIAGSSNTGSVTCTGVDRKIAEQIRNLVNSAKGNAKALREISDKLATIQKEIDKPAEPSTAVTSFDQQGGITAGTVNITGANPVKITFTEVSVNQPVESSSLYKSTYQVTLSGQVPKFGIAAFAPSLTGLDFSGGGGVMNMRTGISRNGYHFYQQDNAFGSYMLILETKSVEPHFQIAYDCKGVTCIK